MDMNTTMPDSDSMSIYGYDYHDSLVIAHAVFASTVVFFLLPAAILTGRYFRSNPWWYKIHSNLNFINTALIITVFALGTRSVGYNGHGDQFTGAHSDTHHRFGLATFLLVMLQAILGYGSHFTTIGNKPASGGPPLMNPGKSIARHVHVFAGIIVAGCLYATVYSGFHEWTNASDNGTETPFGVRVAYWIVLGLEVGVYVLGFALEPGRRQAARGKLDELSMASIDSK